MDTVKISPGSMDIAAEAILQSKIIWTIFKGHDASKMRYHQDGTVALDLHDQFCSKVGLSGL